MIWLLLRLYRRSVLVWSALVAASALGVLVLYWSTAAAIGAGDVHACLRSLAGESLSSPAASCTPNALETLNNFRHLNTIVLAGLSALPIVLGMFMAAPLMGRELENGTHRLIWSQSVTPMRWLLVRTACCLAFTLLLVGVVSIAAIPWLSLGRFVWEGSPWPGFDLSTVAYTAYALFASSFGLAAATIFGRTVVAMAATAVVWGVGRAVVEVLLRPHFMAPLVKRGMTASAAGDSWFLGIAYLDSAGHVLTAAQATAIAGGDLLVKHDISIAGVYQPASRFWTFQGLEGGLFVALAVACLAFATLWVRFRLASQ